MKEVITWAARYKKALKVEYGEHEDSVTPGYYAWQQNRVKEMVPPPKENLVHPSYGVEDIVVELQAENSRLRDGSEAKELAQRCKQLESENNDLMMRQSQYQVDLRGLKVDVQDVQVQNED